MTKSKILKQKKFKVWYKLYDWKNTPFTIKPNTKLVGLGKHKERMLNYVSSGQLCLVVGGIGTGKTSLLKWLMEHPKDNKFLYLNAKETENPDFTEHIMKQRSLFQRIFRKMPKNIVLLLDESQKLSRKSLDNLQSLWDDDVVKSAVLCQPKSDLKQFSKSTEQRIGSRVIRLKTLTKNDAHKLIQSRTKNKHPFEKKALETITEHARGIPRKILEYCELVCIEMQGKKNIQAQDVNNVLREQKKKELQFLELEDTSSSLDKVEYLTEFSPMQIRIIKSLMDGKKTTQQLAKILNTSGGSAGKQLNKLFHSKVVEIVNPRRPKVYDLNPEFKKELDAK